MRIMRRETVVPMITLIDNPIPFSEQCSAQACRFDIDALKQGDLQQIQRQWRVELPEKMHDAVDKRKAEFIAGRHCAALALNRISPELAQGRIGIGDKREPLWPAGVCGAITHSHGFAAAVVADAATLRGIGIDSEQYVTQKTADNVASHILTQAERFEDNREMVTTGIEYLTLVFSAKESIFKCLYPLVQQYFDFQDAVIQLDPTNRGHFRFELRKDLNPEFGHGFAGQGQFRLDDEFVHTSVALKA